MFCKIKISKTNYFRVKNKNKFNLILFFPCLLAGFFVFAKNVSSENPQVIINELMWMGSSISTADEWVELKNMSSTDIDFAITPWSLYKNDSLMILINKNVLEKNDYFLISNNTKDHSFTNGKSVLNIDPDIVDSNVSLPNSSAQYMLYSSPTNSGNLVDSASYFSTVGENNSIKKSMERNDIITDGSKKESWHTCFMPINLDADISDCATPKAKNSNELLLPKEETKIYSNTIILNEVLPYPSIDENEFIELYNPSVEDVNLSDWILRDGSKTGKYIFPADTTIPAQDYLVVYKKDFKFALNNSGLESVTLSNPEEKIISTVTYSSAKKNISYNFDGSNWRWSKFITPRTENIFNNLPSSKTEVPKKIYKNTYADFLATGADKDNDKLKYTWDFGDGHKSYLQETRHKYTIIGNYIVTLKIFDGSEEEIKTFNIEVEKFPALDVNIIGLSPNPAGIDTDSEYILLKNATKKKINLKGWSIATATKKTFLNHPINLDLILKPKQAFKLTHFYSKFSLNNTGAKIELRYPNGKVASKVSYKSPNKSVPDDAIYEKIKGDWTWKLPIVQSTEISSKISAEPSIMVPAQQSTEKTAEQLTQELETTKNLGNLSLAPEIKNKKQTKFSLLNFGLHINTATAFSEIASISNHTKIQDSPTQKHWAVQLMANLCFKINSWLNGVL